MSQAFLRAVQRVMRRVQNTVGVGTLTTPLDDSGVAHKGQIRTRSGNVVNDVLKVDVFGVTSNAPVGSDVAYVAINGDSSSIIVVGTGHKASRPAGQTPVGGIIVYDQAGSCLILPNDTSLTVKSKSGATLVFGADGSIAATPANGILTVNGQVNVTGNVIAGFGTGDQVTLQHHTHPTANPGGPSMPTPGT